MADAGVLAYPVLLVAIYGVFRVGRGTEARWFEWARLATLAILLGFLVAIQVMLMEAGQVRSPLTLAAGVVSIGGMFSLVGLYIYENARPELLRLGA